jgi:D-sedoheptulose 7-phosphate isomerase
MQNSCLNCQENKVSGRSKKVFEALTAAKANGCKTFGLLCCDGGDIGSMVDINLTVPVMETSNILEAHETIIHIGCDLSEKILFGTAVQG